MDFLKKLPSPKELVRISPLSKELTKRKQKYDAEIKRIFRGESNRFLLVIGPCSADRIDAVLDYATRLSKIQEEVAENIMIVPRVYTSKPRTVGNGYKGMLHNPYVGQSEDMSSGVVAVRNVHKKVIEVSGLFPVDELLYPELIQYIYDLLGYVVIGARSVENQQHRLVASGINVPVGMKNPLSGSINVTLNAIETAQHPHHFLFNGWEVISRGNEYAHAVLRGYQEEGGASAGNYDYEHLTKIREMYDARNLENPACIIDCNHSNSGKDYLKQIDITMDVLNSMNKNVDIRQMVKGLMIESYIEDGNQPVDCKVYGKSITDPCLGWKKTEKLIREINERLTILK